MLGRDWKGQWRENPEAKVNFRHPPPAYAALDFSFGGGVLPVPLVGVGVGGSWGKGLSHRDAQVSSRALLATDSGGPPEAGEAFGTDLAQRKEDSLAKQWLPSEA